MVYAQAGLIGFGVLWILGFLYLYLRAARRAKEAESWPSVQGKVLSCEVKQEKAATNVDGYYSSTDVFLPMISYAYSVGERQLEGRRIGFGKTGRYSFDKAQADVARYPAGSTPMVRYNPKKPEDCVLETSPPSMALFSGAAMGLIFVLFGISLARFF